MYSRSFYFNYALSMFHIVTSYTLRQPHFYTPLHITNVSIWKCQCHYILQVLDLLGLPYFIA